MQYQITSDNIQMSPSMEALAKEKVAKLEKQLTHLSKESKMIRVVLNSIPDDKFEVKLLINVRGKEYFAQENDFTLESALVRAVEELERMLRKEKVIITTKDWEEARENKRTTEELLENDTDQENLE